MDSKQNETNQNTHWAIIGILLLSVFFLTPTIETLVGLKYISLNAFKNFSYIYSRLYTPGAGIEQLPPRVKSSLYLLSLYKVDKYKLSRKLKQDPLILQRITEAAWPKKRVENASYTLILINEIPEITGKKEIDRKKDIALVNNTIL